MDHPIDRLCPRDARKDRTFASIGIAVYVDDPRHGRIVAHAPSDDDARAIADALNLASQADPAWVRGMLLRIEEQRERADAAEAAMRGAAQP